MKKQMSFGEKDKELVQRILEFQKVQRISSFTEAVRSLCESGLSISNIVKRVK